MVVVDEFIQKWRSSGGNERANTQLFVADLCAVLGVGAPQPSVSDLGRNDYVFERNVIKREIDGTESHGWIDCYKRDRFILEAKQGSDADRSAVEAGAGETRRDFFGQSASDRYKRGMARRGTGQWTGAMQRAAGQAEGYAKALPPGHGWPPFLLVTDVGWCIDLYANFARDGRAYAPFPDRRRFRIQLDDLHDPAVRERLAAVWQDPFTLDPSAEAARVTRTIAGHLAKLAKDIEARERNTDRVAGFLMRLLFTMFAEDTGLIPKASFSALLRKTRDRPELLPPKLAQLWQAMDTGGVAFGLGEAGEAVRRFNGYLFKDTTALLLLPAEIDVLIDAASADWGQVEPAIFGTLLERALDPKERAKLGAHYTPRAYVERLVSPVIMEPLRNDWLGARTAAAEAADAGDVEAARKVVESFHSRLAQTKVLDPACGTGNFLYVAMARMKELEGEVLELLEELDDRQYLAEISGHTITPENFLGIEINPRAAAIAQLVLWIGYLQWHFRVHGEERMPEPPVLRDVRTIEARDALLTWDSIEVEKDRFGCPVQKWDGETTKIHPVSGKSVPDERALVDVVRYINPRMAKWPDADFIIGNPPFIGNKRLKARLGDGYMQGLRRAFPKVPLSTDLVMYWWHRAAGYVRMSTVRKFGFITTNSITQPFNRKLIAQELQGLVPMHLSYAIPDHPWRDTEADAAVRVGMTVVERGSGVGKLGTVRSSFAEGHLVSEDDIQYDKGFIGSNLTLLGHGVNLRKIASNRKLSHQGVTLVGDGFRLTPEKRLSILAQELQSSKLIKPYIIGRDLVRRREERYVIDAYGYSEKKLRVEHPVVYNILKELVKPERDQNNRASYRDRWWIYAEPRGDMRTALDGLDRYIVTCRTAKHRLFAFEPITTIPDAKVVAIALSSAAHLGVLSSRPHRLWAELTGARLGVGNDSNYNHSDCFGQFPFPIELSDQNHSGIAEAAEALDTLRKEVMSKHDDLSLTKIYNVLAVLENVEQVGGSLNEHDRDVAMRGCIPVIRDYHRKIDLMVMDAYGWSADLSDSKVRELLVALNKQRFQEEGRGRIHWLRSDFQAPGYCAPAEQPGLTMSEVQKSADIIPWPAALPEQVAAVAQVVERAGRPIAANDVARAFRGKNAKGISPVLEALAGMGRLRKLGDGRFAA